ncbi:MAG: GNAT family N-acetyltransferase [Chloroflexi bacterium]|nr:GNAT family N-acetyltransferase [Chloroflexota bacterium]
MTTVRVAVPDDAPAIARVHVDSWRSTYAGIVPQAFLDGLTYEGREAMWRGNLTNPERQSVLLVAEDENGQPVGFTVGGPGRDEQSDYDAELYAIYLLPECQGQGIGRQIF